MNLVNFDEEVASDAGTERSSAFMELTDRLSFVGGEIVKDDVNLLPRGHKNMTFPGDEVRMSMWCGIGERVAAPRMQIATKGRSRRLRSNIYSPRCLSSQKSPYVHPIVLHMSVVCFMRVADRNREPTHHHIRTPSFITRTFRHFGAAA